MKFKGGGCHISTICPPKDRRPSHTNFRRIKQGGITRNGIGVDVEYNIIKMKETA